MLSCLIRESSKVFAKGVLFIMGWQPLSESFIKQLFKHDRIIAVFSHTSYSDFYILILYLLAYPEYLYRIKTLVKPQPFAYAGRLLRSLGAIPATKVEDSNGGAVKRISEELNNYEKFTFLICPKGTILKRDWRSGYYHIAELTNSFLMVVGLDYEKKSVAFSEEISHYIEEPIVKDFLQDELKKIVPLFPECEVVDIREHDHSKRGIVDMRRVGTIFTAGLLVGLYYLLHI